MYRALHVETTRNHTNNIGEMTGDIVAVATIVLVRRKHEQVTTAQGQKHTKSSQIGRHPGHKDDPKIFTGPNRILCTGADWSLFCYSPNPGA